MLWFWITLGAIGVLAIAFLISWPILIRKLMIPNAKPLSDEEIAICRKIVEQRRGYPYVCRWAVRHGACPCLPCSKLEAARR
jgi:hypothetical protein